MHYHATTKVAPTLKLRMINITNTNDSSLNVIMVFLRAGPFSFLTILDFFKMK